MCRSASFYKRFRNSIVVIMVHSVLIHLFCDELYVVHRHFSSPLLFGGFENKDSFATIMTKHRECGDVVGIFMRAD